MKIVFNLYNVGLGNNGGSRTIIKCAETLSSLGENVVIFTNNRIKYTWSKIKIPIVYGEKHPICDVSIATGFKSIAMTMKSASRKKYCYIRGWERWVTNEKNLLRAYHQPGLKCIVNSIWLKEYLRKWGTESEIIYPGLDFDKFFITTNKKNQDVAALYSAKHRTKRHEDARWLNKRCKLKISMLNEDIKDASEDTLRGWYNNFKVWLSTSELEGLHNPPMEAGLCGCALVCTDHLMSGTKDYAIHNKTALVYPQRDLLTAYKYIKMLLENRKFRRSLNANLRTLLYDKIGSREDNMTRLLRYIREK